MRKTIACVSIILALTFAGVASAQLVNGINYISEAYTAGGNYQAHILTGLDADGYAVWGNAADSYSLPSQADPINYDFTYSHSNIDVTGYNWGSTNVSISHASSFLSVSTYAGINQRETGISGEAYGYTTGIWDFHPQYSKMELQFDISYDQGWSVSVGSIYLQDLTTGAFLISQSSITNSSAEYTLNSTPFYSVDSTHTYRLTLSSIGSAQAGEGCLGGSIQATLSSVPEPTTLFILSLGGLFLRKPRA